MWYTIQTGDKPEWLSSLAAKYLGDWQKFPLIYEQNKDVLVKGPDYVAPGMTLWIPIDGKERPSNTNVSSTFDVTGQSQIKKASWINTNKILMIAGASMAGIAILMAVKKK